MRSAEPTSLGVREAAEAIRKGVLSPVELVEACLARIGALDGDLRAWAHVDAAGALAIAGERESEARAGRLRGPLHGVPVGVKDIFDVAGMPTTGGATVSKIELPPSFQELAAAGLTVLEAEAAAYHEPWFVKHADDYGPEMRNLVEAGLRLSATAYVSANRARLAFRGDVMSLLAAHDALLCPTAPAPAPAGLGSTGDGSLCAPWSNAGVPAITLPSGIASSGLPHAIQLVQAAGASSRLLAVAAWCERQLGFTQAPASRPPARA